MVENFVISATDKLPTIKREAESSDIIFYINDNEEVLKICENGDFIVKGNKVTEDIEVYNAIKAFLTHVKHELIAELHQNVIEAINKCFDAQ